jgi:hypothetical protein
LSFRKDYFHMIIQVAVGPMAHGLPQLGFDGPWISIVAIGGDTLRDTPRDCARRTEEGFRRCRVALLIQQDIHQVSIAINSTVQIRLAPFHFDIRFVDVPAAANSSAPLLPQCLAQQRRELCFPLPHRFMRKDHPALQEHFRKITQTQLVPYPPEHHQTHDVGGVLAVVEARPRALIELSVARTAAKAAVS